MSALKQQQQAAQAAAMQQQHVLNNTFTLLGIVFRFIKRPFPYYVYLLPMLNATYCHIPIKRHKLLPVGIFLAQGITTIPPDIIDCFQCHFLLKDFNNNNIQRMQPGLTVQQLHQAAAMQQQHVLTNAFNLLGIVFRFHKHLYPYYASLLAMLNSLYCTIAIVNTLVPILTNEAPGTDCLGGVL